MFSGYFFNPSYTIRRTDGTEVMRLKKQPSFWEGKFILEKLVELDEVEELRALMSIIMATLLERSRG